MNLQEFPHLILWISLSWHTRFSSHLLRHKIEIFRELKVTNIKSILRGATQVYHLLLDISSVILLLLLALNSLMDPNLIQEITTDHEWKNLMILFYILSW
jgi:hypothetical protein